eukprot:gene20287-22274_t
MSSDCENDEEESWKEKFYKADTQVQKFQEQAGKVRELLCKKLKDYEDKIEEANQDKDILQAKVEKLENSVKAKEETTDILRNKITILRNERAKENEVWEEREKIMKNWIKTKIYELLNELEKTKKEKEQFEHELLIKSEKPPDEEKDDENDDNLYEEVFEQILGDLKKPKYEPIWDHSRPTTPVTPIRSHKMSLEGVQPPPVPARVTHPRQKFVNQKVTSFDNAQTSPNSLSMRFISDSDSVELAPDNTSPGLEKKAFSSTKFLQRRFSDFTAPALSSSSPPSPRRRFSRPNTPSPPPPVARKPSRQLYKPVLISRKSEDEEIFLTEHEQFQTLHQKDNASVDETTMNKADDEPFYFTLKEIYSGIEYESENKAPVYATLKGVASQIRESPFSGDSTDSEAEMIDSEQIRNTPPSGFTSYLPTDTIDTASSGDSSIYNLPYDSVDDTKPKQTIPTVVQKSNTPDPVNKNVLKTCAPYTAQNMRTETLEKSGYLIKLGGRVKNWKKRWFTLVDGKLNYYKTKNDVVRKPLGIILLESISSVCRSQTPNTFELCTPKRTYYMTADSEEVVDEWLRVLRNNLKRFAGARLLLRAGEKTIHTGWVTKVKGGVSRHCWCVLREKTLLFYKSESEQNPFSAINVREIINIKIVENSSENSSSDDDGRCTLMIQCLNDHHPIYLVISSRKHVEDWRLNIVNLNHEQQIIGLETDFENLITKLMSVDGDSGSRFWQDPLLLHSRCVIGHSLSSVSSSELSVQATRMFKSISLYSTTPINERAIDYHISLAQDILQTCFTHPELQTEICCQLIKQTTKLRQRHGISQMHGVLNRSSDWITDDPGDQTIDLSPVPDFVYIQCWHLLSLCTSLFLPKLKILWLLKEHLKKNANSSTEFGRYALYCTRSLERTFQEGDREARPSRFEVMAMILRNPYYLPFPLSIPVYFINNTYQVFNFDGSTTVAEFCERINMETGIRDCSESGYALFSDNPIAMVEHCLQAELKLCDVISKWEQALKCLRQGKVEKQRVIKLIYKARLYFKSLSNLETDKEKLLLVYQTNESILAGHLQPAPETTYQLAALLAQIEYGGYSDNFKNLNDVISRFVPSYHKVQSKSIDIAAIKRKMYKSIAHCWSNLESKCIKDCVHSYLGIIRSSPLFAAKLFEATERISTGKKEEHKSVIIAVEEEKITILDQITRALLMTYNFTSVVTFGGYQDDFMLVINESDPHDVDKTGRHLFMMSKGKKIFWPKRAALCENRNSLKGKTVVITGANTGIGRAVAEDLARREAKVILACRNIISAENAAVAIAKEIGKEVEPNIVVKKLDLSSFKSIREFANELMAVEERIDILINNAGIFGCPFSQTEDGFEMTFGVNHLGHFLLTNLLLDKLSESTPSRIIIVASKLYERAKIDFENLNGQKSYVKWYAYAQSKLANLLFAHQLNKIAPEGVTVNSLHPGFVATNLARHMIDTRLKRWLYPIFSYLFMKPPKEGAQTVIYLATANEVANISGKYFGNCEMEELKEHATDDETAEKLWKTSEILCDLHK